MSLKNTELYCKVYVEIVRVKKVCGTESAAQLLQIRVDTKAGR